MRQRCIHWPLVSPARMASNIAHAEVTKDHYLLKTVR